MPNPHADLEQVMVSAANDMGRASASLAHGEINVDAWRDAMRTASRNTHTAATALAQGEWGNVSSREWGHAGARLRSEYAYLEAFAQQISDGTQRVSWIDATTGERMLDGRFASRAAQYAEAGHGTMEASIRRTEIDNGSEWERRVLDDVENCDGCMAAALEGWQPIGTLPEIGTQECGSNCRCEWEYATGEKPED
jgi:hypothetical protein